MKSLLKTLCLFSVLFVVACGSKPSGWKTIPSSEIDKKSYAIAYGATAQSYEDRVNASYDIDAFMRGVDDWFKKKVTLPVEQIRASLLNRMLDHNVYAYYSGVLYAAEFQGNVNRLSPKCWQLVEVPSLTQGIFDAMHDLQKNRVRHDQYIQEGADQILHLCVEQMQNDTQNKQK